MKRFVKSIIVFYLFLITSFIIGGYLNVNNFIDSGYFFMISFYFSVVVLILIPYDLSRFFFRGIKKIYYRNVCVICMSCFLTLLLGCFTLYLTLAFHMAIGGSH